MPNDECLDLCAPLLRTWMLPAIECDKPSAISFFTLNLTVDALYIIAASHEVRHRYNLEIVTSDHDPHTIHTLVAWNPRTSITLTAYHNQLPIANDLC